MSDPVLPPGIRVGSGLGVDERQAVRIDVELKDGNRLALVLTSHQARQMVIPMLDQEDRQVRVLAALLLRQAQLVDEANWRGGLRVVGGREA